MIRLLTLQISSQHCKRTHADSDIHFPIVFVGTCVVRNDLSTNTLSRSITAPLVSGFDKGLFKALLGIVRQMREDLYAYWGLFMGFPALKQMKVGVDSLRLLLPRSRTSTLWRYLNM